MKTKYLIPKTSVVACAIVSVLCASATGPQPFAGVGNGTVEIESDGGYQEDAL